MSIKGFKINGQVQKYDYNALDNKPNVSGLSDQAKEALLNLFQHTAYVDAYGQIYYQALYDALYPQPVYSVTNTLVGCTTTNSASFIMDGSIYEATIVADTGYTLTGATVNITMGGESVTGVYNNGSISIPNVTGDLVITVTAASSVTSISAVFTQGQNVITNVDSLDSLRQYLVVTATYADSTTGVISGYTLSGTLAIGTDTITVTYGGKTDTFDVTVSDSGYLYYWDFTDSLVDRVQGKTASLNLCERDDSGILIRNFNITDGNSEAMRAGIDLGNVFGRGKKIELDLRDVSNVTINSNRSIINLWDGIKGNDDNGTWNTVGYSYTKNNFGIVTMDVGHWALASNTSITTFDGNHTLKLEVTQSGVMSIYKDNTDLNAVYNSQKPTISDEHASNVIIGTYTKAQATWAYPPFAVYKITGVRISNLGV